MPGVARRRIGGALAAFFLVAGLLSVGLTCLDLWHFFFARDTQKFILVSAGWLEHAHQSKIRLSGGTTPIYALVLSGSMNAHQVALLLREDPELFRGEFYGIRCPGYDEQVSCVVGSRVLAYDAATSVTYYYVSKFLTGLVLVVLSIFILCSCLKPVRGDSMDERRLVHLP